ncbi:hypothetical protein FZI91_22555 [Mycobacterium sp. CBMA271]|uniref:hypothetical protein n=1 Tax=unclassified Mycobacteroides TaxID=2618759 RepID=UPI0012DBDAC2|nr:MULTISPECIES: hypothetical protein [unclassified Mycobacteroides]MUM15850.1 hypothetical protein [Mycobacteroides sp. CBMA 326]MUM24461.1 hypothetical protein [Mycobacteroides sp. CBMA 271]
MSLRITAAWLLRAVDIAFVAAVAYLCWTLVWCGGPFERMGWIFPAFFLGPALLLAGAIYFGVGATRRQKVTIPVAAIAGVVALSVLLIGTGVLQKARWAHARSAVLAVADHPPAHGETQHRRIGTYPATVHTNSSGTVLIRFENSWDGLLYVPTGMPEPDRDDDLRIGPEMLPRWWYYDTD